MNVAKTAKSMRAEAMELYKAAPKAMQAYQGLMGAASKGGALTSRTKELMAMAITVHAQCKGRIVFHVPAALKHGATRDEIAETTALAIEMGGGPATVNGGKALATFDELKG